MKALIIGASGNLGLRLTSSLLAHNHEVVVYVRSPDKLRKLLPSSILDRIELIEGDATDSSSIKAAVLNSRCDAVVNSAGLAALPPWSSSDLPKIFKAVLDAVVEASHERKQPLRVWFLGGLGVLQYPSTDGGEKMLSDYVPIYLEHRVNVALLRKLPPATINWSMLCPATMTAASSSISEPTTDSSSSTPKRLIANATTPPLWQLHPWLQYIPFVGRVVTCAMNASRYEISLEQCADFLAEDLETEDSKFIGQTVGVISGEK